MTVCAEVNITFMIPVVAVVSAPVVSVQRVQPIVAALVGGVNMAVAIGAPVVASVMLVPGSGYPQEVYQTASPPALTIPAINFLPVTGFPGLSIMQVNS